MEQWQLYCKKADFADLGRKFNISPMLARIIRNRGMVSEEEFRRYLHADINDLYDPFLLKGMDAGVWFLHDAVQKGKRIRIIGDYDVDGICASLILKKFIDSLGAEVDVRLPDRMSEGYGMNSSMIEEAKADNVSLIITCDNGISAVEAIAKAKEYGIEIIVTDHHEPLDLLPDADVIIDPKQKDCPYPFKEICGASVAYKLVLGYNSFYAAKKEELLDELLEWAGMATIADIVPLIDENRIIASEGIKRLKKTNNTGLNALIRTREIKKEDVNSYHVGFILGPAINSAGRLENAMTAFKLFMTESLQEAEEISVKLSRLNDERKYLTQVQEGLAVKYIKKQIEDGAGTDKVLVLFLPDAHESVAGIVAGRIKDDFNRPAIVVTRSEEGLKGSGRSIDGYNMIEALNSIPEFFTKFGGHSKACGFSLKMNGTEENTVAAFRKKLNEHCNISDSDLVKKIWIDMQLPFRYVTEEFTEELLKLEPFGLKNEKAVFAEKNVKVLHANVLGKNYNVLKLDMEDQKGSRLTGIKFLKDENAFELLDEIKENPLINILYYPAVNEFRGIKSMQAVIQSLKIVKPCDIL